MLVHLAIHTPRPEHVDDMIASMERFAAAGRSQAGLQEVHTMRDADSGKLLGLDAAWAYRVIKQVGNYGESFERNLGPKTPVALPRGVNNLWTKGGLMYAPPLR